MKNKAGQLCNRIFAFGHFIGNALEHGHRLINPTFDEYCRHFPSTRLNDFGGKRIGVRLPGGMTYDRFERLANAVSRRSQTSVLHRILRLEEGETEFDLNDAGFVKDARSKVVLTDGWLFQDPVNFRKHADTIRAMFKPDSSVSAEVAGLIANCRRTCDVLVGVHIRQGDYRQWQGGKYSYENNIYREKMCAVEAQMAARGRRAGFLACSNEAIPAAEFAGLQVTPGPGQMIEDLYSLAACDYLIGPPSTYSGWASFYGKVPLMPIAEAGQAMPIEEFRVTEC
jgi:hypothetical protein